MRPWDLTRWALAIALGGAGWAQVTQRVSVASDGTQGNWHSGTYGQSISADGRYVVYSTQATNLVPGDTNNTYDILVRDRVLGVTERVSVDSAGAQVSGYSHYPSISADGRYVAFTSTSPNLVPGDTNQKIDVFVRDRQVGTTERVSLDSSGTQGNDDSGPASISISGDGRYVAFYSYATNLVPGDTNGWYDVFVRDRQNATTERVSVDSLGTQGNFGSTASTISADGRYVAFHSFADNLILADTNGTLDCFVRDRQIGSTERVSVSSSGQPGNHASSSPTISADGRYVAFVSLADNLVPGDWNDTFDVFVRDRQSGATERVSVSSSGSQGDLNSAQPSISANGRLVGFESVATNLVPGDTNGTWDAFVHDCQSGTTELVSVASWGAHGNGPSGSCVVSAEGNHVVFGSFSSNLVPNAPVWQADVYVHEPLGGPSFTSLCEPGSGGVSGCPCANPPGAPGRGCDNSAGTGGALLSASGGTYLSSDTLTFTTNAERPAALSILCQWSGADPGGTVFGQGVRCTAGPRRRLYTKSAIGGSISAPDLNGGDPQVSARSAALGEPILPGQDRWYVVYYRDPIVLGGCPATSTFNATQTGRVSWLP